MSTVKVFVTVTSVEPRSVLDTKNKPTFTPRTLIAGEFYDVQKDVAEKLIDLKRAELPEDAPKNAEQAAKEELEANQKIPVEDTIPVATAGGLPSRNTEGGKVKAPAAVEDDEEGDEEEEDEDKPSKDWPLEDLKAYAKDNEIDLAGARTKDAVLAKIEEAA